MFKTIKDNFIFYLIISISSIVLYITSYYFYSMIRNYFIRKNLKGKTVLITGGTKGIGKELAKLFIENNFNIIITGKNIEELINTKKELIKEYETKFQKQITNFIKYILIDFNKEISIKDLNIIFLNAQIEPRSIYILINTICNKIKPPQFFLEDESIEEIININILNTLKFTKYILRNFIPTDTLNKKCIIFMGNVFGEYPSPLLSTFSASKAFLTTFSKSLSFELETTNINVEIINTLFIANKYGLMKENIICPSIKEYALSIFHTFGSKSINAAYYPHIIIYGFLYFIPEFIISSFIFTYNVLMKPSKKEKED